MSDPRFQLGPVQPLSLGKTPISSPAVEWVKDFGTSAVSSVTELIGIELDGVAEWRQDNPWSGFVSQLAGAAVPYTGWFKASKLIKPLDNAVRRIGNVDKAPFTTGALREAARFAPFEVGRVAVSQAVGDESLSSMATDAALSLGLGAGIGGLVHGVAAAGTRAVRPRGLIPGVAVDAPAPLKLRKMREIVAAGEIPSAQLASAEQQIRSFDGVVRGEDAELGKYVLTGNKTLDRRLNRLFQVKDQETVLSKKKFIRAADTEQYKGFASDEEWKSLAQAVGLPPNFTELGQYFRHVSFSPSGRTKEVANKLATMGEQLGLGKMSSDDFLKQAERMTSKDFTLKKASLIDQQLTRGMDSVGDGWYMKKEPEGLFVLAKKATGTPGKGGIEDSWVLLKTDKPGAFLPKQQRYADVQLAANSWHKGAADDIDFGPVGNAVNTWFKNFPVHDYTVQARKGALDVLGLKGLVGESNEVVARLKDSVKTYLAPTGHQLKHNPLANHTLQSARLIYDTAENRAHQLVHGKQAASSKNLFAQALSSGQTDPFDDSIRGLVQQVDDSVVEEFRQIRNLEIDPSELMARAEAGEFSRAAMQLAGSLSRIVDDTGYAEYEKAMRALGETPKKPRKGHYGLSNSWEGVTRIPLRDAEGVLQALAGGKTRKAAQQNAKKILEKMPDLKIFPEVDITDLKGVPDDMKFTAGTPGFLQSRRGIRGFKYDFDEKWTKDDLIELYEKGMKARYKHIADKLVEEKLAKPRLQLDASDPAAARIVDARINDLAGIQSPFSAWQNKIVDGWLGPVVGQNSASKIVGLTNTGMFSWHMGMGNLSHPVLNALTFVQNVNPEAALLMSGSADAIAPNYHELHTWMLANGVDGPAAAVGVLSAPKIMLAAAKEMRAPRAETSWAFARAGDEGVTAPRMVEDFIGDNAAKVKGLKEAFANGKNFLEGLHALSNWLPANSEKMARAHAFTVGWIVAKDVFKIADNEVAYRTARQFTERTMYLYSAADRPKIFTTPAGSAMGLFKTWMMNYMATTFEYIGLAQKGIIAPLAWQTAGTAALGGVAATPLSFIADGFSRAFTGDPLLQNAYENMNEFGSDTMMFGLPAALTGVSLYSQTSSPLANPVRDASMLWSSVTLDRAQALGKSVGSAIDHWKATGEHPGRSPAVRDQIFKALAPSTVSRTLAAFSGEDAIRSLSTGYPITENTSLGDRMLYAVKYNPLEIDKAAAVTEELYQNKKKRLEQTQTLGKAFLEAQQANDGKEMGQILRQGMLWGIASDKILTSFKSRLTKTEETQIDSNFKPADIAPWQPVLGRN